jgi:hypothetical protein
MGQRLLGVFLFFILKRKQHEKIKKKSLILFFLTNKRVRCESLTDSQNSITVDIKSCRL